MNTQPTALCLERGGVQSVQSVHWTEHCGAYYKSSFQKYFLTEHQDTPSNGRAGRKQIRPGRPIFFAPRIPTPGDVDASLADGASESAQRRANSGPTGWHLYWAAVAAGHPDGLYGRHKKGPAANGQSSGQTNRCADGASLCDGTTNLALSKRWDVISPRLKQNLGRAPSSQATDFLSLSMFQPSALVARRDHPHTPLRLRGEIGTAGYWPPLSALEKKNQKVKGR